MQILGTGASGFVSRPSRAGTKAVKHFSPEFDAELKFEVQIYELLGNHPRIAKFHGPTDQGLVLDYYRLGSVFEFRLTHLQVPLIKWSEQIAEGLAYIHSKEVTHCDLRPENLLVTETNDVVLIDFGSSMLDGVKQSNTAAPCRYRPAGFDEQGDYAIVGDDLFALGTVMYFLATGQEPYQYRTAKQVKRLYAQEKFPDVSTLPVGEVIMNCWLRKYSCTLEALEDIRKCINSPICEPSSVSDAFADKLMSK